MIHSSFARAIRMVISMLRNHGSRSKSLSMCLVHGWKSSALQSLSRQDLMRGDTRVPSEAVGNDGGRGIGGGGGAAGAGCLGERVPTRGPEVV